MKRENTVAKRKAESQDLGNMETSEPEDKVNDLTWETSMLE